MGLLLQTSLSRSSVQSYTRHWSNFQDFVFHYLKQPFTLPVSTLILGKYVSHLCLSGYSYATILTIVSVISFAHKIRDIKDPAASFIIAKLLKGVKNRIGRQDTRKPITLVILKKMLYYIDLLWRKSYLALLLRTIFTLMFAFALRVGEVAKTTSTQHTLKMRHVFWIKRGSKVLGMRITLSSYKASEGRRQKLRIMRNSGDPTCPVQAVLDYVCCRGQQQGFLFQFGTKEVVTRQWLVKYLNKVLKAVNLREAHYNTHSFRIGACTHWAQMGASITTIKMKGRWRSFAFTKYLRPTEVKF